MNDGENYRNAFQSHKRTASDGPTLSPWMITALQATKLLLFALCNIVLTLGSVFSKLMVLIMATNIVPHTHLLDKFSRKCSRAIVHRTSTTTASIYTSLILIQCLPDVIHFVQSILQIWKGHAGRLVTSLVVLECMRTIGLSILTFHVFPQLDLARCLVLGCCFPLVAVFQRSLIAMMSAARTGRKFRNRLFKCILAMPHVFMCIALFSSCYLWTLFDGKFTATIALPIGIICTSIGYWESWIDTTHANTSYDELYRIKYAVRKMNNTTKAFVSFFRIFCTLAVMVAAVFMNGHTKLQGTHFFKAIFQFSLKKGNTMLIMLALSIIVLHLMMRGISSFLAALGHPPIFYSVTNRDSFFFRISSMPPICDGLRIEQSLVVFQHSLNRQEKEFLIEDDEPIDDADELRIRNDDVDRTSTVYACATMWHETETEMRQVLRSILKLDVDHATRMNNKKSSDLKYRLEGHIFFDERTKLRMELRNESPTSTL